MARRQPKRPENISHFTSVYFDEDEFRCKCCGVLWISPILILGLEKLVRIAGRLRIVSGYRCERHNEQCGGKGNSQHLYGNAADVSSKRYSIYDIADAAGTFRPFKNGGIGLYRGSGFVHLDVRGHAARW